MTATMQGQRIGPAETRRLIDDYTLYRFGYVLSPPDFAKQAGTATECIEDLLAQKPIPAEDMAKIARSIDVSLRLLSEIAGYAQMSPDTHASLDRFFDVIRLARQKKKARAA